MFLYNGLMMTDTGRLNQLPIKKNGCKIGALCVIVVIDRYYIVLSLIDMI